MSITVQQINIFPVKACAAFQATSARVEPTGLSVPAGNIDIRDRSFILRDVQTGRIVTLRDEWAQKVLPFIHPHLTSEGAFELAYRQHDTLYDTLRLPSEAEMSNNPRRFAIMHGRHRHSYLHAGQLAADWFSDLLGRGVELCYADEQVNRRMDPFIREGRTPINAVDDSPFSIEFTETMDWLKSVDDTGALHDDACLRFRSNLILRGGLPFLDDVVQSYDIMGLRFERADHTKRCDVINTEPVSGRYDVGTTNALAPWRLGSKDGQGGIYYASKLCTADTGVVRLGDAVDIVSVSQPKSHVLSCVANVFDVNDVPAPHHYDDGALKNLKKDFISRLNQR
jgi:uncharacterized protein YcbX